MAKYAVTVARVITEYATVEVEAPTSEMAESVATFLVKEGAVEFKAFERDVNSAEAINTWQCADIKI
jgi:hypothetical protein